MKPHILIIGSCVCDVVIEILKLPATGEDVNVTKQTLSLGGCAYNVANILQHFKIPFILFAPIGKGIYADFVRKELHNHNVHSLLDNIDEENGCCYCMVEENGERTFISHHGAEYKFKKEWFALLKQYPIDTVYICGLEIEEDTGIHIINYLKQHQNLTIYFAPGPRICHIDSSKMNALFSLSCILHINEQESLQYSHKDTIQDAALYLYSLTHAPVIITLGDKGSYCFDGSNEYYEKALITNVVDTIGAGDGHIGAIISSRENQKNWQDSLRIANQISAKIVAKKGASLK